MKQLGIIEDVHDIRNMLSLYFSEQKEFDLCFAVESASKIPMGKIDGLDIVLCDIGLPGKSGMEITWFLKQKNPELHIVMFTVLENEGNIFQALQAGASGYLLKDTPLHNIKQSLLDVLEGGAAISPMLAKKVIDYFKPSTTTSELTERETQVLQQIQEGNTNKQVAESLQITPDTVKFHIKNIYEKLKVSSRAELFRLYK
ncbi:MAG TPA: response regulator transcription factor [Flavobacteriaceae bacterium]|nr:response regulator transcription factor [Flavobacteriaceae bacterium]